MAGAKVRFADARYDPELTVAQGQLRDWIYAIPMTKVDCQIPEAGARAYVPLIDRSFGLIQAFESYHYTNHILSLAVKMFIDRMQPVLYSQPDGCVMMVRQMPLINKTPQGWRVQMRVCFLGGVRA